MQLMLLESMVVTISFRNWEKKCSSISISISLLINSLVYARCSLVHLLCAARYAHALHCAYSGTFSLIRLLRSSWESGSLIVSWMRRFHTGSTHCEVEKEETKPLSLLLIELERIFILPFDLFLFMFFSFFLSFFLSLHAMVILSAFIEPKKF